LGEEMRIDDIEEEWNKLKEMKEKQTWNLDYYKLVAAFAEKHVEYMVKAHNSMRAVILDGCDNILDVLEHVRK
jgi:hypothetical protein